MNNPYATPKSQVADSKVIEHGGWFRTVSITLGCSLLALFLSWGIAPSLARILTESAGLSTDVPAPLFFILDELFSLLSFFVGCFLAARLSKGQTRIAVLGVALAGWLVYFVEVGGIQGMLHSEFPLWYEFFPSHCLPAVVVLILVRQRES